MNRSRLADGIRGFLQSCPQAFDFPLGGTTGIPMASELELMEMIENAHPVASGAIAPVRKGLDVGQAYSLVIVAVRMAVYAVRTRSARLSGPSMLCLVIDDELVDWRDVLRACSIIEDCTSRLGIDFRGEIEKVLNLATDRRRETIVKGYLSREPRMRKPDVMGFAAKEGGDGLYYEHLTY